MSRLPILRILIPALALATACASEEGTPPPPETPAEIQAQVEADVGRLEALGVVPIGEPLVADVDGAVRFHDITDAAVDACTYVAADPAQCTTAAIDANLAVLRDLAVVEVGDLIVTQPANNPDCYNLPCPGDEAAAEADTCLRATKLSKIAAAVRGL